jgi:hypothetical protein
MYTVGGWCFMDWLITVSGQNWICWRRICVCTWRSNDLVMPLLKIFWFNW